jgi:hypothetical protein
MNPAILELKNSLRLVAIVVSDLDAVKAFGLNRVQFIGDRVISVSSQTIDAGPHQEVRPSLLIQPFWPLKPEGTIGLNSVRLRLIQSQSFSGCIDCAFDPIGWNLSSTSPPNSAARFLWINRVPNPVL